VKRDTAPEPTLDGDDAVEWGGNEVTPVARVCPDCTAEQIVVGNFVPPPDSMGARGESRAAAGP
jgi:hypothetical protein